MYRILSLLRELHVPATFFVPGWVADHYPEPVRAIMLDGHEVAHHGYTHVPPYQLSEHDECEALLQASAAIERVVGRRPVGYRSPAWDFSPATLNLLSEQGFLYSSNMMDDDRPYRHANGVLEFPVQWILDDAPFFSYRPPTMRPIHPTSAVWEAWTAEFQGLYEESAARGTCCVLTMHPQMTGRPSRVALLRRFITWAQSKLGVEFLRGEDLVSRVGSSAASRIADDASVVDRWPTT